MGIVMNADSPLLFFDSGVGGLSVLEPVRKLLPTAPIVYAADSAGYPTEPEARPRSPRGCRRFSGASPSASSRA
jgi:glutamate racemase